MRKIICALIVIQSAIVCVWGDDMWVQYVPLKRYAILYGRGDYRIRKDQSDDCVQSFGPGKNMIDLIDWEMLEIDGDVEFEYSDYTTSDASVEIRGVPPVVKWVRYIEMGVASDSQSTKTAAELGMKIGQRYRIQSATIEMNSGSRGCAVSMWGDDGVEGYAIYRTYDAALVQTVVETVSPSVCTRRITSLNDPVLSIVAWSAQAMARMWLERIE